jgi:hypothetical protein
MLGGLSPNIQVQATLNMILMEYNIFYIEVMLRLSYKDLKEIYGIQRYWICSAKGWISVLDYVDNVRELEAVILI